jgi:hypothetical protein
MQGFSGALRRRCPFSLQKGAKPAAMLDIPAGCTIESSPTLSAAPGAFFRDESL